MSTRAADGLVFGAWERGLRPDPVVSISEWIEANVVIPTDTAAPGEYRFRRVPYLKEILEALAPDCPVQRAVAKKAAQLGFTVGTAAAVGFYVVKAPRTVLFVSPTVDLAKRASKRKFGPIFRASDAVRDALRPARERDEGSTTLLKEFDGGALIFAGANSGAGLRQTSAPVVLLDELDVFPESIPEEGDPMLLAERASKAFPMRKLFYVSTPTILGRSRVCQLYDEQSDRRKFFVPCPICGGMQTLYWQDPKSGKRGVRWEGDAPNFHVWYECALCGAKIEEGRKGDMLEHGEWRPEVPALSDYFRGYEISALYASAGTFSWLDAVRQWVGAGNNVEQLRTFVNQVLGQPWEDRGEAPPWEDLYRRREQYKRGTVPAGAAVVTAGADVQRDRIEVELVGWGPGMESWSVDYHVFPGDTAGEEPWQRLDALLARPIPHERGAQLKIRAIAVDSGFETSTVYAWTRRHAPDHVFAVRGSDHLPSIVGAPAYVDFTHRGKRAYRAARVWQVGVSVAKRELYGFLRLKAPLNPDKGEKYPAGYCHFPQYEEERFRQITAEKLVPRQLRNGRVVYQWQLRHERNEGLDCRNYARAAAAIVGLDRYTDREWQKAFELLGAATAPAPASPRTTMRKGREKEGRFYERWRGRRPT